MLYLNPEQHMHLQFILVTFPYPQNMLTSQRLPFPLQVNSILYLPPDLACI